VSGVNNTDPRAVCVCY